MAVLGASFLATVCVLLSARRGGCSGGGRVTLLRIPDDPRRALLAAEADALGPAPRASGLRSALGAAPLLGAVAGQVDRRRGTRGQAKREQQREEELCPGHRGLCHGRGSPHAASTIAQAPPV